MKTFKDVKIGQTFCITATGTECKKLSNNTAIGLMPEYCGVDFQDVRDPKEFKIATDTRVYSIKGEGEPEIEYSYSCSSSVIWGSFDYGTVWARSKEEAKEKAKEEITKNLEAINSRLKEIGQTFCINLDCLEIEEAKNL